MKPLVRLCLVAFLMLGCVGCDQATKSVVRSRIELGHTTSFFADTLRLTHAENPGAFLSIGADLPQGARVAIFQGAVGLLVAGLLLSALLARGLTESKVVSLTLLAASGLGNLIDRMMRDGVVTDFLNVGIGPLRTGIFNVADIVGVAGVAIYLLSRD